MTEKTFTVNTIGYIHAGENGFSLEIAPEYRAALTEIQQFRHLQVLWWCHLYDEHREILECDQPYQKAPAKMGIFATRSPLRPNPIALTTVEVLSVDAAQGVIYLTGIDAEDGTPILDIKPYYPCEDRVRDVTMPTWCADWPAWLEDSATFDWSAVFVNAH
ncbi:MAG: tRNA (N6-threonylcarbamoyladenosine(37)-N6)-methyltransferase TrmO [Anaerolineae bacterium]|nr:tRNA (N6-threonylcarbamoyladenosine(37)-N6)-methyltransferase TrmO [Anaerolineae bacterium]